MEKLFSPVQTAYDPKAKPVHICKTEDGKFYVYKPSSGFKSRAFDTEDDEALTAIFERQRHDGQTFASYLPGEKDTDKKNPIDKPYAADIIKDIEAATTVEDLEKAFAGDERVTVLEAYNKRLDELKPAE